MPRDLTTIKKQILGPVTYNRDSTQDMVCFYIPNDNQLYCTCEDYPCTCNYMERRKEVQCTFDELPDYEYDCGYGGQEGPTVRCYTENYIYFTHEYDGAEWINSLPRNPIMKESN